MAAPPDIAARRFSDSPASANEFTTATLFFSAPPPETAASGAPDPPASAGEFTTGKLLFSAPPLDTAASSAPDQCARVSERITRRLRAISSPPRDPEDFLREMFGDLQFDDTAASSVPTSPLVSGSERIAAAIAAARECPFETEEYLLEMFEEGVKSTKTTHNRGRVDVASQAVPHLCAMFDAAGIKAVAHRNGPGQSLLLLHYK